MEDNANMPKPRGHCGVCNQETTFTHYAPNSYCCDACGAMGLSSPVADEMLTYIPTQKLKVPHNPILMQWQGDLTQCLGQIVFARKNVAKKITR